MAFLTKINNSIADHPLILLDVSGSTLHHMNSYDVLYHECKYVAQFLKKFNVTIADIILWSSTAILIDHPVNIDNIYDSIKDAPIQHSNTYLGPALKLIEKDKYNDIIIVTDGEIHDNSKIVVDAVKELFLNSNKLLNLYLVTVEANHNDFRIVSSQVGTEIYDILYKNFITNYIRYYIRFNYKYDNEPFINLYNPIIADNYIPFGDEQFHIKDHELFLDFIIKKIHATNNDLIKIIYDLSYSVKYILKNTPTNMQPKIIEQYMDIINESDNVSCAKLFLELIKLHQLGFTTTFESYNEKRNTLFSKAKQSLQENTAKALTCLPYYDFITVPVMSDQGMKIFQSNNLDTIYIKNNKFNFGGIKVENAIIPILPLNNIFDHFTNQSIRIWIRMIYASQFNCNTNSDIILYAFLGVVLKVIMSDLPIEIKNIYRKLGIVLLDRNRYGSNGVTENEFLKSNKPKSVSSESINIEDILAKATKLNQLDIDPLMYWYACVCALNNSAIKTHQLEYCKNNIIAGDYDIDTFFEKFTQKYRVDITLYKCASESNIPIVDEYYVHKIIMPQYNEHKLYTFDDIKPVNSYEFSNCITISKKLNPYNMNIKSSEEFKQAVKNTEYHFINDIDLSNVVIAGGFCRSIIYNQQIEDIDLFIYGLPKEQYIVRAKKLISDILDKIDKKNLSILCLDKKDSHVIELLCVKNTKDNIITNISDIYTNKDSLEKQFKFQIILRYFDDINSIFNGFDIDACCTCYNGENVLFNERGLFAYTYGVSKIVFDDKNDGYRFCKYFDYGFDYIFENIDKNELMQVLGKYKLKIIDSTSDGLYINCSSIIDTSTDSDKIINTKTLYKNSCKQVYNGVNLNSIAMVLEYCDHNANVILQLYDSDKCDIKFE